MELAVTLPKNLLGPLTELTRSGESDEAAVMTIQSWRVPT